MKVKLHLGVALALCATAATANIVRWDFPRTRNCHEGLPFSDGVTGVLVWGGDGKVNLTVGRSDMWDHRGGYPWLASQSYTNILAAVESGDTERLLGLFKKDVPAGEPRNPYMLPLGRVVLGYPKDWTLKSGSLDTMTGLGDLLFVRKGGGRGNVAHVGIVMPKASRTFALSLPKGFAFEASSLPATDHEPFFTNTLQRLGFTKAEKRADGFDFFIPADAPVSLHYAFGEDVFCVSTRRTEDAIPYAQTAATKGFAALRAQSIDQWTAFWKEGARIRVPDATIQRLYDYGMYRFGAMTDPDGIPAGLQGPWLEDDRLVPWNGDYHFNINVQECYAPAYRGGHFAHLKPLFKMVLGWRPRLRENAKMFCGISDGYSLPHSVDDRGVCIGGFWTGTIDHGSTAWVAAMMYRYVKYSGDVAFLKDGGYDFMKGAMNVYLALFREKDGKLTLPMGPSPEWGGAHPKGAVGRDASFQLAAAHRLARDLTDAAKRLGEPPDPRWEDVAKRLPLYNAGARGFRLFGEQELTESHRHHSHMAALYPFDVIDFTDPKQRADAEKTYNTWVERGTGCWTGWCVPWAAILNLHFGSAEAAVGRLHDWDRYFCDPGHGSHHNAVQCGFTAFSWGNDVMQMDGQCAATAAVLEMLAHETNGKVEFFKGCPESWKDVMFENLALSDGTRVNGRRVNGKVIVEKVK